MRTSTRLLPLLALAACGGTRAPMPPPDLSGVVATFSPSKATLGAALGTAAILGDGDAALLQQLGIGLVRRDFLWSQLEPQPGDFQFADEDRIVDDSRAHGIATIGILAYGVAWASAGGDEHAPPDPDAFATFAETTAAHFAGRVDAWEIWNEPNIGFRFWKPAEDPAAYADLLAHAYPAVKRGNPAATVALGGLSAQGVVTTAESFLADAYFARPDLGAFFDAVALHPYPHYPPSVSPETSMPGDSDLATKIARLRAMLAYYGDGDKAVWVTEYGWPVQPAVDEAAQARWLVRGAVGALAAGADRVCFYTLHDGPNPTAFPPEDAFGILRNDGTRKPAAGALEALLAHDPASVLRADESDPAQRRYRFRAASGEFSISWALPDGDPSYGN
jgi:hypothetical protein